MYHAGVTQRPECNLPKVEVRGSNPLACSNSQKETAALGGGSTAAYGVSPLLVRGISPLAGFLPVGVEVQAAILENPELGEGFGLGVALHGHRDKGN